MKITFLGGAKTVTGSSYLLEIGEEKILVDCGLFQGSKELEELNYHDWSFNPRDLSFVLLTHAHIDHSGLLPKLKRDGFRGKIICTKSTKDLCSIMLPDSGHIHELEAEWKNRKRLRQQRERVEPLYTEDDARDILSNFVSVPYYQSVEIGPNIKIRMNDAGHILGSAIIEMWVHDKDKQIKIVFSGDIGSSGQAIVRDPDIIHEADYLFIESTYGNRLHPPKTEGYEKLVNIIREAHQDQGTIIIPAFAVGRTQELLYQLNKLYEDNSVQNIPVYVDSPLAVSATEIFHANSEYYDQETKELIKQGDNPLAFHNLHFVRTREESQKLNNLKGSAIIISANGMASSGRVLHHLKHGLWKKNNHIVFVGYQAEGSLGKRLLTGSKYVNIMGQSIKVGAKIHDLSTFSAHADQNQLVSWLKGFTKQPKQVFIVHGEEESAKVFSSKIRETLGWSIGYIPTRGETVDLHWNDYVIENKEELSPFALADAELQSYLKAIEHNLQELKLSLSKHSLSDQQASLLNNELVKLTEEINEINERV